MSRRVEIITRFITGIIAIVIVIHIRGEPSNGIVTSIFIGMIANSGCEMPILLVKSLFNHHNDSQLDLIKDKIRILLDSNEVDYQQLCLLECELNHYRNHHMPTPDGDELALRLGIYKLKPTDSLARDQLYEIVSDCTSIYKQ